MLSYLKKKDEDDGFAYGDVIFLLVIGLAVGGFWFYSNWAEKSTYEAFNRAGEIFESGNLVAARPLVDALTDLPYTSDSLDSIHYVYQSRILEVEELERTALHDLDSLLKLGDTASAQAFLPRLDTVFFLEKSERERINSLASNLSQWKSSSEEP